MNLYSALVTVVAILAVVRLVRDWQAARKSDPEAAQQSEERIAELEQRICTLERLVTDERASLRRRFDDLE